jgi:2,4-dienoyl-CoA reductase-like NADH-dependent reductase (Old Yellow Enzyme family)
MNSLLAPITFSRGPPMKNRFMLAPLTNTQSHENGMLSEEELHWLTMRARGGFGLTMTCAAHVQEVGKGFPGQLGIWADDHVSGLTRLAQNIKRHNSLSIVQLHHAGMRSPGSLIGTRPVCPSDDIKSGARALSHAEVEKLIDDFIVAAQRSEQAGYDGIELHGAHGYILCQFFSAETNKRMDEYGGTLENRYRILFAIIEGIRSRCRDDFMIGVRLSPERFGLDLGEVTQIAEQLMLGGQIEFLDLSLWDSFKQPEDPEFKGRALIDYFTTLPRGDTRLGVAGNIRSGKDAESIMEKGIDWIMLGRAAMWQHDFPNLYRQNPAVKSVALPVTRAYLSTQGLSSRFIDYVKRGWPKYVKD